MSMIMYTGFTGLCKGLVVVLIGGHIIVQILSSALFYLALIPAKFFTGFAAHSSDTLTKVEEQKRKASSERSPHCFPCDGPLLVRRSIGQVLRFYAEGTSYCLDAKVMRNDPLWFVLERIFERMSEFFLLDDSITPLDAELKEKNIIPSDDKPMRPSMGLMRWTTHRVESMLIH
ncbi:hypothetical protein CQW23_21975 [Capsicum baccatum]|uniref:Uncharacterized protein n=1 Tax=Capsicum baccatum TaxID=33114 RepID=A0A2G2VZJ6_CAPBA|nr:hypothetical protein CQW23_21975 [Capsicum baccatum]